MYISRDVLFDELTFPFAKLTPSLSSSSSPATLLPHPPLTSPQQTSPIHNSSSSHQSFPAPSSPSPASSSPEPSPPPPSHTIQTRSKSNLHLPKIRTDGTVPWPPPKAHFSTLAVPTKPQSYTQVSKFPQWCQAMQLEFDALIANNTWTLVPPSSASNVIGCKRVFRTKRLADGSLDRYKARLVAKGYHQHEGLDYSETFSPVVKPTTIRLVLSLALSLGWKIKQLDVMNAFLHGTITEQVFMTQPTGYVHPQFPHYVCKLNRTLYGLKQAPRAWYARLSGKLFEMGFSASKSDSSLFIYTQQAVQICILAYADDVLITGSHPSIVQTIISALNSTFPLKDLGNLHYFLSIECRNQAGGLLLSQ